MTEQELKKILEAIQKAYKEAGKTIDMATLHEGDETTIVIDNREEQDIN
jgi:hypothetical protein